MYLAVEKKKKKKKKKSLYFQRNPSPVPELNDGYYECSRITM